MILASGGSILNVLPYLLRSTIISLHCRNEIFPFNSVEDHELVELLVYNSNTDCLCSDKISRLNLESLPCFDLSTFINNNPNLSSIDIDLNLPSVTNFGYYSTHEFHSNEDIRSTISDRTFFCPAL